MSPNSYWNIILASFVYFDVVFLFGFFPVAYFALGHSFDKKFQVKNYTIEKGVPIYSGGLRFNGVVFGILLQPYRDKKIRNTFFANLVKKWFAHQDTLYDEVIDLRRHASRYQIWMAKIYAAGMIIMITSAALLIFHDFVLYPDFAKARMAN